MLIIVLQLNYTHMYIYVLNEFSTPFQLVKLFYVE